MHEPQSRCGRYLNDMIYENGSLAESWGGGGGQAAGRETPVLLPHSEPSPAGTQQRNYRDCTCSGAHGHAHGCTSSQQGPRALQ